MVHIDALAVLSGVWLRRSGRARMTWVGHVARMGGGEECMQVLEGLREAKRTLKMS